MSELTMIQRRKFGLEKSHLCEHIQGERCFLLDPLADAAFRQLQSDAAVAGFDLKLVSAFRDFYRQKAIWQAKAVGKRDLLDNAGAKLDFDKLDERHRLLAILRWSAIPGASRHHWGTDVDVFDAKVMSLDDVQLVPSEVESGGPMAAMHEWLDARILTNESYGFYRPYCTDSGGVAPERWHLSYLPQAKAYMSGADQATLLELLTEEDLALLSELREDYESLWKRFVDLPMCGLPDWVLAELSKSSL